METLECQYLSHTPLCVVVSLTGRRVPSRRSRRYMFPGGFPSLPEPRGEQECVVLTPEGMGRPGYLPLDSVLVTHVSLGSFRVRDEEWSRRDYSKQMSETRVRYLVGRDEGKEGPFRVSGFSVLVVSTLSTLGSPS